jgi:hypothetical protein
MTAVRPNGHGALAEVGDAPAEAVRRPPRPIRATVTFIRNWAANRGLTQGATLDLDVINAMAAALGLPPFADPRLQDARPTPPAGRPPVSAAPKVTAPADCPPVITAPARPAKLRGPTPRWAQERIAKLRELWAEGVSAKEIGRALAVSRNAVFRMVYTLDLPRRRSRSRRSDADAPPKQAARREAGRPTLPPLASLAGHPPAEPLAGASAVRVAAIPEPTYAHRPAGQDAAPILADITAITHWAAQRGLINADLTAINAKRHALGLRPFARRAASAGVAS